MKKITNQQTAKKFEKLTVQIGKRIKKCRRKTKRDNCQEYQEKVQSDQKYQLQKYLSIPDITLILDLYNRSWVSSWEKEKNSNLPTLSNLIKMANFFKVNIDWLLFGVGNKKNITSFQKDYAKLFENDQYKIAQALKAWRESQGLTRNQLAKVLECGKSTMYSLENGTRSLTTRHLLILYIHFYLTIETLYKYIV